jgi:hypothetical protein
MSRAALVLSVLMTVAVSSASAQQLGRPQDGFYSGQVNGQVDLRVDGRASKNEGLPPSAADKSYGIFENPLNAYDCVEVQALKPDARPGYQARVREACGE